jgi:hypothetical protein
MKVLAREFSGIELQLDIVVANSLIRNVARP